jgi:hypothetical protein
MNARFVTFCLLLPLAWTCCAARQAASIPIQSQTLRQGIAYITYPEVVGPKAGELNPLIERWIGRKCDSCCHDGAGASQTHMPSALASHVDEYGE